MSGEWLFSLSGCNHSNKNIHVLHYVNITTLCRFICKDKTKTGLVLSGFIYRDKWMPDLAII